MESKESWLRPRRARNASAAGTIQRMSAKTRNILLSANAASPHSRKSRATQPPGVRILDASRVTFRLVWAFLPGPRHTRGRPTQQIRGLPVHLGRVAARIDSRIAESGAYHQSGGRIWIAGRFPI